MDTFNNTYGWKGGGQHLKMLNENKIKQPKQQTPEYYKIARDEDNYVLVD